jgi:hypothetical protein
MKNFLPLFILLVATNYTFSQTTLEDYNYITKGYKEDVAMGKDFKAGYAMKSLYTSEWFDKGGAQIRKFEIARYVNSKNPGNTIAVMILLKDQSDRVEWVFCMPSEGSSQDLWKSFWTEVYGNSSPGIRNAIIRTMSQMLMKTIKKAEVSR